MRDLDGLIRMHRWQLDEKRRALAELEAFADRLSDEMAKLDRDMEREKAAAAASAEPMPGFAAWRDSMLTRRKRLEQSMTSVNAQLEAARDDIAAAFQELKKFELARDDRRRRADQRRRRAERQMFDDIALEGFRRRAMEAGD